MRYLTPLHFRVQPLHPSLTYRKSGLVAVELERPHFVHAAVSIVSSIVIALLSCQQRKVALTIAILIYVRHVAHRTCKPEMDK